MKSSIVLFMISFVFNQDLLNAYKICVVGATSGLGKELIYQGVNERKHDIIALSNAKKDLSIPCRTNSFQEIKNQEKFNHPNIISGNYWEDISKFQYEHLILTTSAKPFEDDYSDKLTKKLIEQIPKKCKSITLISAYGVGDSLKKYDPGIGIMNAWYLKDVYRAKNEQENILKSFKKKIKIKIFRPKALSYGDTILNSISRKDLAEEILDNIDYL